MILILSVLNNDIQSSRLINTVGYNKIRNRTGSIIWFGPVLEYTAEKFLNWRKENRGHNECMCVCSCVRACVVCENWMPDTADPHTVITHTRSTHHRHMLTSGDSSKWENTELQLRSKQTRQIRKPFGFEAEKKARCSDLKTGRTCEKLDGLIDFLWSLLVTTLLSVWDKAAFYISPEASLICGANSECQMSWNELRRQASTPPWLFQSPFQAQSLLSQGLFFIGVWK